MLNYENQLNLGNIYSECQTIFKEQRPEFLELLDKYEVRSFCGIDKVPDASKFTRFKQDFANYLQEMFIALVDVTEPFCNNISPKLASMLSYDTSAVESYVTENNPKYLNSTIHKLKAYIPLNIRATSDKPECPVNENGIPVCPLNHSLPMVFKLEEKLEIAKQLKLMSFLQALLNYLLSLLQMQCPNLNTLEVLKNLLVNIWFSMF